MVVNLKNFFEPERIAVIGASRNPSKVGHVIMKNILDGGYPGEVIPVNPNAEEILRRKAYGSVKKIEEKVDLAIISVPAEFVLKVVRECKDKGIKDLLIISSGFAEIGNKKLEDKLADFLNNNKMSAIGVNCLGIYDSYNKLDTLFLPRYRLRRPEPGAIGFICQSGAVGSATMDIATEQGHKFSKFISYGNATHVDESDLIEYLGNDDETKVICLYVEGIKNGEKFYKTVREVSKKKPIIALKGGLTEEGNKATMSHTGSLAGKKEVYLGIFKQTGVIKAESLEEMFSIASLVEKEVRFDDNRVQVITNGGGYGIISTDNISESKNLKMAELSGIATNKLRRAFPKTVNVRNPLDLGGDATNERYKIALEACIKDKKVDCILLIVLYQTPLITTDIIEVISEASSGTPKPIVVVSTGGEFTEKLSNSLEKKGLPVFSFPKDAITAMDKLVWWENKRKSL
jgi:acetate---CoA ligase (ADP-forming)